MPLLHEMTVCWESSQVHGHDVPILNVQNVKNVLIKTKYISERTDRISAHHRPGSFGLAYGTG